MKSITEPNYGTQPVVIERIMLDTSEMMFWLYCPISMKDSNDVVIPDTLKEFSPIIDSVLKDLGKYEVTDSYIYLTAKTLWVERNSVGNREGWHSDGFGTDDLNYIWYSNNPTRILNPESTFSLSTSHQISMDEMSDIAKTCDITTYPAYTLLKLDQNVIHNTPIIEKGGYRTFVKVSVSKDRYNLIGNSHNHDIDYKWKMYDRSVLRNDPYFFNGDAFID